MTLLDITGQDIITTYASPAAKCNELFTSYLNNTYENCINDVGTTASVSMALCGIFALFYIGNIIWKSWCQGGSIDLYACMRPFCIAIIIVNFEAFVGLVDTVVDLGVNQPTKSLVDFQANKTVEHMTGNIVKINEEPIKNEIENSTLSSQTTKTTDNSSEDTKVEESSGVLSVLGTILMRIVNMVQVKFYNDIYTLFSLLGWIASVLVQIYGMVTKIILVYVGPFVFALSLIPYFSDGIRTWLGRFISVSLYGPCINIINFVMMKFYTNHLDKNLEINSVSDYMYQSVDGLGVVVFSLASAFCFFAVPSIASFLVSAAGANALHDSSTSRETIGKVSAAGGMIGKGLALMANSAKKSAEQSGGASK